MVDFFYSDPHFGHSRVVGYRPFSSVETMNRELVLRYNKAVGRDDLVLWLGDCFFMPAEDARRVLSEMNGRKLLVRGNHDGSPRRMASLGFELVTDEAFLAVAGRKVRVSHYPYAGRGEEHRAPDARDRFLDRRPPRVKGEVLLHGHTHSARRLHENMVHVGVDAWDYRPAPIAMVERLVRRVFGEAA